MWLLLASMGVAGDDAGWWWQTTGIVALQPSGALTATSVQYRAPVLRYGGAVFNDTFVGAGARASVTPAFAEAALRFDAQPIDVLPITVELVHSQYWRSPFGLLGFSRDDFFFGTDDAARRPRYQEGQGFAGHAWSALVSPTGQIRVGPVVAFSAWTASFLRIVPHADPAEPWVYEPYRGMVVGYEDVLVEHTSAVLWEARDGEDQALLRLGAATRGKWSEVTPDGSLAVGAVGQWRPGTRPSVPTMVAIVAPYVRDPDLLGPIPFFALVATWEGGGWLE